MSDEKTTQGMEEQYFSILEGITMYALGDSLFFGARIGTENSWPSLLGEKYGMHFINYGRGSNTIAKSPNYPPREYFTPMVERYKDMENGDAQLILFEGGRNDRTRKVPFGRLDSSDPFTFRGAIHNTLKGLKKKYPNAFIICVTCWNYRDTDTQNGYYGTTEEYGKIFYDTICALGDPKIVCLPAFEPDFVGVDMNDGEFREKYCVNPDDISHLNVEGMKYVLPKFEKAIATEYGKYLAQANGN